MRLRIDYPRYKPRRERPAGQGAFYDFAQAATPSVASAPRASSSLRLAPRRWAPKRTP